MAASAVPTANDRNLFFAWSTYTTDYDTYAKWYDEEHIPQVMDAPGMLGAQRFLIADTKPIPGSKELDFGHLALYEMEGSAEGFREEVKRKLIAGEMLLPDYMVQPFKALFAKSVSAPQLADRFSGTESLDDRHLFFAWSRHTGDDDTFAKWYDEVHIPQIMTAPGVIRAERFEVSEVKPLPGVEAVDLGHLAIYETVGDLEGFRAEVKRQLMSGEMEIPDFMISPFATMFLKPASPFFVANGS
ncbi:hypothetical protein NONO_c28190 [Nocardia nova SH22a]|uniref:EthD domain-containing protein n=1 Tax=Nocardia nova SH22a TaxID=1415166 RepID=W5TK43_9NOCA|nr:hypothetical protein [Nocardia nova]AHH17611.1 hypothetical protein NONO_c28190 [Nocardia nova SH22a]